MPTLLAPGNITPRGVAKSTAVVAEQDLSVICSLLSNNNAVVDHVSSQQWTSWLFACIIKNDGVSFSFLLSWADEIKKRSKQIHYDVNAVEKQSKCSLLHKACSLNRKDMVSMLLSRRDVDVQMKDQMQATPLHYAACNGALDCVLLLLGVSWLTNDSRDAYGNLPIHLAIKLKHYEVVKALLDSNPNMINARKSNSKSCLHVAVDNLDMTACKLLTSGHEASDKLLLLSKDENHMTALLTILTNTSDSRKLERMKLFSYLLSLCEEECDKHIDRDMRNIYHLACIHNQVDLARVMALQLDRDQSLKLLCEKDKRGQTPFHICAKNGQVEMMSLFLLIIEDEQLHLNVEDRDKLTPVMSCVKSLLVCEKTKHNGEDDLLQCLKMMLEQLNPDKYPSIYNKLKGSKYQGLI